MARFVRKILFTQQQPTAKSLPSLSSIKLDKISNRRNSSLAQLQEQLEDYIDPPRVAGRPFLPGNHLPGIPKYLNPPRPDFPKLQGARDLGIHRKDISPFERGQKVNTLVSDLLLKYGAVLIDTDVGLRTKQDYEDFVKGLGWPQVLYTFGTGIRETKGKNVFSASDEPPEYTIECHNEMSYKTGVKPARLGFFSLKPGDHGGETVICHNRELWEKLDKDLLGRLVTEGIRYHWFDDNDDAPNPYRTWKTVMLVETKEEAESLLRANNYDWEWTDDGLSYWLDVPAMSNHPVTGESVWFNQVHCNHKSYFLDHPRYIGKPELEERRYPATCFYTNWDPIEQEVIDHIRCVTWRTAVGFKLKHGQVVLLDNYYAQHARLGFQGTRKLLVSLFGQS